MAGYKIRKLESPEFDHRLLDRHIAEGRTTEAKFMKSLDKLEDMADNAVEFRVLLAQGDDPIASADEA